MESPKNDRPVVDIYPQPPSKKSKIIDLSSDYDSEQVWLSVPGCFLTKSDKVIMHTEEKLNDCHIQWLLLQKFRNTEGLLCTLFLKKCFKSKIKHGIHWLVAFTLNSVDNKVVEIYDSMFTMHKPHKRSKLKEHCKILERHLVLWKDGKFQDLMKEDNTTI